MAISLKAKSAPGRGCKCCAPVKSKTVMRRMVRRTEKQSWKKSAE